MAENKVKYGLSNVWYAIATINDDGTASYGTPVRFPGAVSLSLEPQGDQSPFYADDIVYWIGQANNGYQGDFEIALIPDAFYKDVLGYKTDSNGVMVEDAGAQPKSFALMFEGSGDQKKARHVLYNCVVSRPTLALQTKQETVEPQTETITLTASTIWNNALEINTAKAKVYQDNSAVYAAWNNVVYIPGSPAPTVTYTVTQNLTGVTSDFTGTTVNADAALTVLLSVDSGSVDDNTVSVMMGGTDITSTAYDADTDTITIAAVTGNVVITANAA